MIALVWSIIGIALAAALIYSGMSYFQGTAPERLRVKEAMIAEVGAEKSAYQAFITANATTPSSFASQIVGYYLSERKSPISGMTWSDGTNATYGRYICLSGSVPSATSCNGLADATASFASNSYWINSTSCTTRSTVACSSINSWPSTMYITYWLKGA